MTSSDSTAASPDRPSVLLIDDAPENLTVLGEILAPHYAVKVAPSGARGLAIAMAKRPDLVLLDVMMPGMDGYEVLWRLQQNEATRGVPVIFVTALDGADDEARGLELGVVDYITKPVKPPIVLARVRTHLELAAARDRLADVNTWLEDEVAARMRDMHEVQIAAIQALASIAHLRDDETGSHIVRTQSYVRILASELAKLPEYREVLTPDVVELYAEAAPLHDMGKVGIPDSILRKPGKLDAEEWAVMRTHAELGAAAIARALPLEPDRTPFRFLGIAADIARSHHEKWDGSGYPRGLAGKDIPLPGRIMAVADVFDALISKRAYKAAFPIEEAMRIVVEERGRHFDPDVVEAFVARIEDLRDVAARHPDHGAPGRAAA